MNTAKLNPLIELSEAELSSTIEFTYPIVYVYDLSCCNDNCQSSKNKKIM